MEKKYIKKKYIERRKKKRYIKKRSIEREHRNIYKIHRKRG